MRFTYRVKIGLFAFFFLLTVGINISPTVADELVPAEGEHFVIESVPDDVDLNHPYIPQTAEAWIAGLETAEESIKAGLFYIQEWVHGETNLDRVLDKIVEMSREGVEVEILTDTAITKPPAYLDEEENIEVRYSAYGEHSGGVMHAKYFIVDEELVYLGSANFDWRSLEHIREVGLAINEPEIAADLNDIFEVDWQFAGDRGDEFWEEYTPFQGKTPYHEITGETFSFSGEREIKLTASPPQSTPPGVMRSDEALIKMINTAENYLYMDIYEYDNWDFYAGKYWDELDRAIRRAEVRGVDVRILVPDWVLGGSSEKYLKSLAVLDGVEVKVMSLPQSEEWGFIPFARTTHPKLVIIDGDMAWLGSTNLSYNYFNSTRDIDAVTRQAGVVDNLRTFFLTGYQSEYVELLKPEKDYRPPIR